MAKLKLGKYYEHDTTGEKIHIIGEVVSSLYGKCFCAESTISYDFRAVTSAAKWKEIKAENFDLVKYI
jgi:hypothetical protein